MDGAGAAIHRPRPDVRRAADAPGAEWAENPESRTFESDAAGYTGFLVTDLKADLAALRIERPPERLGRRWIGWLVVFVLIVGGGAGGWVWATRDRPIAVQVVTASARAAGTKAEVLNGTGYVTAR